MGILIKLKNLQTNMKVKFKKLDEEGVTPTYAKPGDAGLDLTAIEGSTDPRGIYTYKTGIAVEIPEGFMGLIFPRSSVYKQDLILSNSIGVIDSGYRGEIIIKYRETKPYPSFFVKGERVAQLIILPVPYVTLIEVEELTETARGEGGHGSTGA
jgi:dUTP pyrophosphatase